jgi:drug/metabolite transporter (DMT)-like permease
MSASSPSSGSSAAVIPPAAIGAIAITVLAWASAFLVIRGVGSHFSGGALALARLLVGALLLGLVQVRRKWIQPTAREGLLVFVFGVAWFGTYNVSLNFAEHTLDAGTSAMIVNIGPILIALGAGMFLGEGISRWLAIGAGVAFLGVVLIGLGTRAAGFGDRAGMLWALFAAMAYSIGVLCQKAALKRLPVAQVTWLGCVIGAVACLPFLGHLIHEVREAPARSIIGAIYLGAIPTALAFSCWAYALSKMPAGQLGVTTYIVPAIVVLLGFLILHEVPASLAIVGGAICLLGVALSRKRAR